MRRIENDRIDDTLLDPPRGKSSLDPLDWLVKGILDCDPGAGIDERSLQRSRGSINVLADSRPKRQTHNMYMPSSESPQALGEPFNLLLRLQVVDIPTKLNQLEAKSKKRSTTNQEMWIDRRAMPTNADAGPKKMSLSVSIGSIEDWPDIQACRLREPCKLVGKGDIYIAIN